MKFGFVMPSGDARDAADLAAIAEDHGWDGFFVWEGIWSVDAWTCLAAAAMRTQRIRLGTMLTPLPRRKPWELASQTSTLDNLSGGRVILAVGLGVSADEGDRWWLFEDDPGRVTRAEMLDEGLEMLQLLWRGEPFEFHGRHYRARRTDALAPAPQTPVQKPRIPIWVVGAWPRPKSMRRAAAWDGWLPNYLPKDGQHRELTPQVCADGVQWIRTHRGADSMDGYDVVVEGVTSADDPAAAAATVRPWAEAGATWWLDANWSIPPEQVREESERRLRAGPPRID
ncbi:LLM class flavin-dependent oxidoreductase [Thermasporomyces composti]|jgi:alkanesulfonate monooxygenase SsuD/methylene tetrahydromethanopterin reductase-like flavin-dependent oxidoreductase (luciferase family)|uniref:Alkanesulfonate monooxygenase SsuD/methylene tetrahydromethanopterin reductase-like flavin-dependent oxidoreductase (Luciferase family) n=1 Tax=Thermasporomyces composti TaxID=696763 RepID=A0A3D9V150_THECX|nr:LLM class flavin-dependent oxidoreductase [Thermasporomyces composti]REF35508.1 alkanesulfonate monooxygenase SsuD/methylene tetrahydromethanopterin reductase-like flavin-dependent oxidoreductase (luciferase family) [Thermasporomyces composti]